MDNRNQFYDLTGMLLPFNSASYILKYINYDTRRPQPRKITIFHNRMR
uniref:Uncharacterized protein n=1 Tax=Rhizophora mucronata TaxID=61149 RepID=A0A2P2QH23_RHIMU